MTNAWSDRTRRSIMNLCVNSKLGTIFLSSKECSNEAHTSQNIFEYVDKCMEEVGSENVVQIVTDNASTNMGASKLVKDKRPTIFLTSCATHTINLMLEAIGGLPRYKKTLDQAKKATVFIYAHHKSLALMRKYTNKRNIVRPGVTRFASAFLTLQSLLEKKTQLRHMFTSEEWDKCKLAKTVKGKLCYDTVIAPSFWSGVTSCLKLFAPLVKVLRMADADWKPAMGFIYGELKKARDDLEANDAVLDLIGVLFPKDFEKQSKIISQELPIYMSKERNFGRETALLACEANNEHFDPANWWDAYGNSTPNLKKIAVKILSLTTSSSGCERNWSIFEGVHTKKRNRLEASRMNDLVCVQFNANLMEKNNKRKLRNHEVLVADDGDLAREWIIEDDEDEVDPGNRTSRQLDDEEFVSEEVEVDEEVEYESDGVEIIEQYGQEQEIDEFEHFVLFEVFEQVF